MPRTLVPGDHNDVRLAVLGLAGLDLFQHQKTAALGQHHVQHHQVGQVLLGQFHSPIAVVRSVHDRPRRFEGGLHADENVVVVIDQQNSFSFKGLAHRGPPMV